MLDVGLPDIKICSRCGVLTYKFGASTRAKDGRRSQCKDCEKVYEDRRSRNYKEQYRDKPAEYRKNRQLKNRYGITLEDYNNMLQAQNGSCAMCPATALDEVMCVDHNHATGDVRAILCKPCNTMLGMANDSAARLQAGIDYLQEHGSYESNI